MKLRLEYVTFTDTDIQSKSLPEVFQCGKHSGKQGGKTLYQQVPMNVQELFAERIGGRNFGQVQQTFKFTLIDNAKRQFIERNPTVKVIDMGVGEPEELPSAEIREALRCAAEQRANRIYPNNGIIEFRRAAAAYLRRDFGLEADPDTEIMHCIGTKTGLAQIPLAFVDPGDVVLATVPGYPVLPRVSEWLGGKVINMKLLPEQRYLPSVDEIRRLAEEHKPKLLLLNYPNNPTGGVATREFLSIAVELAHRFNFVIVQDAAYADFVFNGEYVSPLHITGGKEVTLELYSLSKSYNMQGYRLGFVVGSAPLVKAYALVKDNIDNGQFIAIQRAGIEALENGKEFLRASREKYKRRLHRTAEILTRAGIKSEASPATFYLYVSVPREFHGKQFDSPSAFADYLITTFGIVTVPWDEAGASLRLSMTFEIGTKDFADEESVYQALERRLVQRTL